MVFFWDTIDNLVHSNIYVNQTISVSALPNTYLNKENHIDFWSGVIVKNLVHHNFCVGGWQQTKFILAERNRESKLS